MLCVIVHMYIMLKDVLGCFILGLGLSGVGADACVYVHVYICIYFN